MPPTGGIRTSMSWRTQYGPLGPGVTDAVFSPGQPLTPPDQEPVRIWDFQSGGGQIARVHPHPRAHPTRPMGRCGGRHARQRLGAPGRRASSPTG
jgi:hypothetical protein